MATEVGCCALPQGIVLTQGSNLALPLTCLKVDSPTTESWEDNKCLYFLTNLLAIVSLWSNSKTYIWLCQLSETSKGKLCLSRFWFVRNDIQEAFLLIWLSPFLCVSSLSSTHPIPWQIPYKSYNFLLHPDLQWPHYSILPPSWYFSIQSFLSFILAASFLSFTYFVIFILVFIYSTIILVMPSSKTSNPVGLLKFFLLFCTVYFLSSFFCLPFTLDTVFHRDFLPVMSDLWFSVLI